MVFEAINPVVAAAVIVVVEAFVVCCACYAHVAGVSKRWTVVDG